MNIPLPVKQYDPRRARTWAEIDLGLLATNVHAIAETVAPDSVMAIVKADAYGHGAVAVSRVCATLGVEHFGVATVEEGLTLRKAGVRGDIYLLAPFLPDEAEAIVRGDLVPLLSSFTHFHALVDAAKHAPLPARAFMVVDTGMGREGMLPEEARSVWHAARSSGNVRLTGITSHLACADDREQDGTEATIAQAKQFVAFVASVAETFVDREDGRGNRGVWLSLCNSPGTVRRSEWTALPANLPGVRGVLHRAGLLLYGIEPYVDAFAELPRLRQVLNWRARVTLVRTLPEGATIGYGRTHTLRRPARIATIAAGYADGFPRRLSDRGIVLWRGQQLPIVGRVSMDQLQIDVTNMQIPVEAGEIVTLLGGDANSTLTTLAFANSIDATPHEPTCYLTSRVPRLYVNVPNRSH